MYQVTLLLFLKFLIINKFLRKKHYIINLVILLLLILLQNL